MHPLVASVLKRAVRYGIDTLVGAIRESRTSRDVDEEQIVTLEASEVRAGSGESSSQRAGAPVALTDEQLALLSGRHDVLVPTEDNDALILALIRVHHVASTAGLGLFEPRRPTGSVMPVPPSVLPSTVDYVSGDVHPALPRADLLFLPVRSFAYYREAVPDPVALVPSERLTRSAEAEATLNREYAQAAEAAARARPVPLDSRESARLASRDRAALVYTRDGLRRRP